MSHRPAPFCLTASDQGTFIVNRNDYCIADAGYSFGVGNQLFRNSAYDKSEVDFIKEVLTLKRNHAGDGVIALDAGANIGVCTVEWAKHLSGWGGIIGFEAQEFTYYALAGNVVLNNCLNAKVLHCALGNEQGNMQIPRLDQTVAASFGSLEIKQREGTEFIGQDITYSGQETDTVQVITIDSLQLPRVDFIKIDVEGMELDVLQGARQSLLQSRPVVWLEIIKSDVDAIEHFLTECGYSELIQIGNNALAVHQLDPMQADICLADGELFLGKKS
jgi:FkbM family methyltransferase